MTKKDKKIKKIPYFLLMVVALCFTLFCGTLMPITPVYAYSEQPSSITNSTNLNFSYNGNTTSIYTSPTGWTKGLSNNETTSGVINLSHYNDSFNLPSDQMPSKILGADDHVLMLNSKTSSSAYKPAVQYYTNASDFALNAYSSYKIKVYTQVTSGAMASIYVDGLEEELSFENINYENASEWTAYTFYITTGFEKQNIKLQLWLGSKPNYTSTGAVFFDNIEFTQISKNEIDTTAPRTKLVNLDKSTLLGGVNADFETNSLADWTSLEAMSTNSYAEIVNLSNSNESDAKGIPYVGTDLSKNNNYAFVLYTKNDAKSYIGYKSQDISLNMYDIVKITINAKTADLDGSAYVKIVENDVKDFNGNVVDAITPNEQTITLSSNSGNKFLNDYTTCTFYLKGRSLYNTSYNIQLWLGSKDSPASGLVAFDNITTENISYEDYSSASTSSTAVKMAFDSDPTTYNISNSAFNDVKKSEKNLTYPLIPNNWTHTAKDEKDIIFGVVNTNDTIYNPSDFAGFANPGNPNGFGSTATDTNNILVMQNVDTTYQSVKSSSFSIDSNSYYKLSFSYKVLETASDVNVFNVYINDENNNTLYANERIANTDGVWKNYVVYINTKAYKNTLNLVLSLGTQDNMAKGIAYIDNVVLVKDENMTDSQYEEIAKENNVLDFEQGNFNLVKYDKNGIYTPLRYTEKLESDSQTSGLANGFGGIIDADNQEDAYEIEKSPNSDSALTYLMVLQTMNKATYSLTAKDSLSLSSDTYHKFSIDVKTQGLTSGLDYDKKYGATFALSGLDEKLEGIVAENWTTYTIYVASTSSVTVNVQFALVSLDDATCGNAFFDNFNYEVIDKETYNLAKLNALDDGTNLFIGNTDSSEDETDNTSKANLEYIWYVIPTLILAVALIVALVAYLMKKVNIKKWEKRKINEYDRDKTVHRDVIRAEAEKRRDASVKELKASVAELEKEKEHIENVHQEQLKASRSNRAKGISKATEREFKQYAKLHTAIENRIATVNKQIDKMNTAEYLLSVQHKIMLEKAKQERIAKEKAYEKEKQEKKAKKNKK